MASHERQCNFNLNQFNWSFTAFFVPCSPAALPLSDNTGQSSTDWGGRQGGGDEGMSLHTYVHGHISLKLSYWKECPFYISRTQQPLPLSCCYCTTITWNNSKAKVGAGSRDQHHTLFCHNTTNLSLQKRPWHAPTHHIHSVTAPTDVHTHTYVQYVPTHSKGLDHSLWAAVLGMASRLLQTSVWTWGQSQSTPPSSPSVLSCDKPAASCNAGRGHSAVEGEYVGQSW